MIKTIKFTFILIVVIAFIGCSTIIRREAKLTINSEPSGAKIYQEGILLGNAPIVLIRPFDFSRQLTTDYLWQSQTDNLWAIMQPISYTAIMPGYKSQTRIFQMDFSYQMNFSPNGPNQIIYDPGNPEFSFLFALEPEETKSRQQQQQQQTTVVVPPTGGTTKTFGTVTIITTPSQAEIYIDGTFIATSPAPNLQLEVGTHKIEIEKSGYKTWTRTMQILANSPVTIDIELEKKDNR